MLYHGFLAVIQSGLQAETLARLHDGHRGVTKTLARARTSVWLPGLSTEIDRYVTACEECTKRCNQPPETLMPTELPDCLWQRVASDICDMSGTQYLVTIDYFSRYLEVQRLSSLSSAANVKAIHTLYASHGYPEVHVTDNGPEFAGETFRQFRRKCSVHRRSSSPKYSQSNGEAEQTVV